MVWFVSKVRTSNDVRRQAGILWDLATFWPRAAHPFGPPCYAERVVPEVTRRVRQSLAEGRLVILSGHSQGSVIAVAVAARLGDDELRNVRLVTYGSQLRVWFGRSSLPCWVPTRWAPRRSPPRGASEMLSRTPLSVRSRSMSLTTRCPWSLRQRLAGTRTARCAG